MIRYLAMLISVSLSFWFGFNYYVNSKVYKVTKNGCSEIECSMSFVDKLIIPYVKTTVPKSSGAVRPGSIYHIVGQATTDIGEKEVFYKKGLEGFPLDEELLYDYAKVLIVQDSDYNVAIEQLDIILKANPNLLSAQIWKAIALLRLNKCEELEKLIKENNELQRSYNFLMNYFCLGITLCEYQSNKANDNSGFEPNDGMEKLVAEMMGLQSMICEIVEEREKIKGFSWKSLASERLSKLIAQYRKRLEFRKNSILVMGYFSKESIECRR